ncbi:MAG TPA: hypothetical protein PK954_13295 [Anaerolineales bacterium]|nr:hypothetical protein [Anaerolineales bacterium]
MVKIDHNGLNIEAKMDPKNPGFVKEAVLVYGAKWRIDLGGGASLRGQGDGDAQSSCNIGGSRQACPVEWHCA